ncbi:hypothetical protein R4K92_03795 [Brachyspira intermedia]|uniref:hypothetical protein n=1 Tax=Brachyspira intermedia TaxID=84377 RepID=UPI00260EB44A|nr:hypothetical protein [uncultured Brachyspira sp.]
MEIKIERKTAEIEFNDFCEMWDIDNDVSTMSEEDKEGFEKQKNTIIKAIMQGRLTINKEDRTLKYIVSEFSEKSGEELKIRRLKGADYMSMDNYKEKENVHKMYSVIGNMIGRDPKFISNLDGADSKLLQAVMILFIQG